jgi:hypothetical protein
MEELEVRSNQATGTRIIASLGICDLAASRNSRLDCMKEVYALLCCPDDNCELDIVNLHMLH